MKLLILTLPLALCTIASAVDDANELSRIMEGVRQSQKVCAQYSEDLKPWTELDNVGGGFKNRDSVDKVLQKLDTEAKMQAASQRIFDYATEHSATFTEEDMISVVWTSNNCGPVILEYRGLKGLIHAAATQNKAAPEFSQKIRRLASKFLENRTQHSGTMIEQAIYLSVLNEMIKGGLLDLTEPLKQEFSEINRNSKIQVAAVRARSLKNEWPATAELFRQLPKKKRQAILTDFKYETAASEKLRKQIRAFYMKALAS